MSARSCFVLEQEHRRDRPRRHQPRGTLPRRSRARPGQDPARRRRERRRARPRLPDRSWTPANQRRFLEYIADGTTAEIAARFVGLSFQSAYAFRRTARGAAFNLGWRAASLIARDAIADKLMERAMIGQTESIVRPDGSEIVRTRFDNRLATTLLRRLDRQVEEAKDADIAAARIAASEFDAYFDLVEQDGGAARAGLFLARRSPAAEDARDLDPIRALAAADRYVRTGAGVAAEVDIADLDPARRADWTGAQWARAEAAGLVALAPPPPEPARTPQPPQPPQSVCELEPVWEDEEHGWITDAPPPEDFDGEEEGEYGDEDYSRTLTEDELEIWLAPIAVEQDERRAVEAKVALHPPGRRWVPALAGMTIEGDCWR